MMAGIPELQLDVEELQGLKEQAKRRNVKNLLEKAIREVKGQILTERSLASGGGDSREDKTPAKAAPTQQRALVESITKYGHEQTDKFMTIHVDLKGVQNLPPENVQFEFKPMLVRLTVNELEGKNYELLLSPLAEFILPDQSKCKVGKDKVKLMLRKKEKKTWAGVKGQGKPEPATKPEEQEPEPVIGPNEDPGEAMMKLLKNMYDNGDEELKKTIAKAWDDSRKQCP